MRMLIQVQVKFGRLTWDCDIWSRPMGSRRGPWRYDPGMDADGYHFRAFTWGVLHMTWFTTPRRDPVFTERTPVVRQLSETSC